MTFVLCFSIYLLLFINRIYFRRKDLLKMLNKKMSLYVQALLIAAVTAIMTIFQLLAPLDSLIKDSLYQLPDDINKKIKIKMKLRKSQKKKKRKQPQKLNNRF